MQKLPLLCRWTLRSANRPINREVVLGDFEESFNELIESQGSLTAFLWCWRQTLRSIPTFLKTTLVWRAIMIRNYFKVAWRNLMRQKMYTILNVAGLAVGIACCLLILLYVQHELSFDRYHEKANRIYRLQVSIKFGEQSGESGLTGAPTAHALKADFPEVEETVRVEDLENYFVRYGDRSFRESDLAMADSTLFDVFTIPLLRGNKETALNQPGSIVISQMAAEKYFGSDDPMGKILRLDDKTDYKVTGIFKNIPDNSHFHYDFIISMAGNKNLQNGIWTSMNYHTYVVLHPEASQQQLETKFPEMVQKYCDPEFRMFTGHSYDELVEAGNYMKFYLMPLADIHLYGSTKDEMEPGGDPSQILIFSIVAVFILLLACVNFMNLTTARSARRAREVGIRKVVGSQRSQLIVQFLSESIILGFLSMVVATVMVVLLLPAFNNLAAKQITASALIQGPFLLSMGCVIFIVGILAGFYPALFLSSHKPVTVLRQKLQGGSRSKLRDFLVIFQFTISVFLIISTFFVVRQLQYIRNKKLGFDKKQILLVEDVFILGNQLQSFKQEILKKSQILSATASSFLPTKSSRSYSGVFPEGFPADQLTIMQVWNVDPDYIRTMGIEILMGRDFSQFMATDSKACIINEAAAKQLGWDTPLGKHIGAYSDNSASTLVQYTVIGLIRDFHYETMRIPISPLCFYMTPQSPQYLAIRIRTENLLETVDEVRKTWQNFSQGQPFSYSFLDDRFDDMYRTEERMGTLFSIFSSLAVVIGCLGLIGLAAFTAEQRVKEIGIRKVLGATVAGIIFLLIKDFGKLVCIAILIASPLAYYFVFRWLQSFSYRSSIQTIPFIAAGIIALVISMVTVSFQAFRAAFTNPVKSLRIE